MTEETEKRDLPLSPAHAVPLGWAFARVETGRRDEPYRHEYFAPPVVWELAEEATSNLLVVGPEESGKTTLARGLLAHALRGGGDAWRARVVAGGSPGRAPGYLFSGRLGNPGAAFLAAEDGEAGELVLRGVLEEMEERLETAEEFAGRVSQPTGLRALNEDLVADGRDALPRVLVVVDGAESLGVVALADELAHRGWPVGVHVALVAAREETIPSRTLRAFGARLSFRRRMARWVLEDVGRRGLEPGPVPAKLSEAGREPREIAVPDTPPEDLDDLLAGAGEGATP